MHSDRDISVELVFNHLTQLINKTKAKQRDSKHLKTALIALDWQKQIVPRDQRCKCGFKNPKSWDHPEDRCWHKHKHLAPEWWKEAQAKWRAQFKSKNKEVAYYHALITTWIEDISTEHQIILDSGASCHIFNSKEYFIKFSNSKGKSTKHYMGLLPQG